MTEVHLELDEDGRLITMAVGGRLVCPGGGAVAILRTVLRGVEEHAREQARAERDIGAMGPPE